MLFKTNKYHLLAISFSVFIVINLIENLIHYNIGRHSNSELKFETPTNNDWIKIIIVMIIFATLQGTLTCYFDERCN
jgi:hypothetical protein